MKKVFDRIKATFIIDQLHLVPEARTFFQPGSETVLTWPPSFFPPLSLSPSLKQPLAIFRFPTVPFRVSRSTTRWRIDIVLGPIRAWTLSFWTPNNAVLPPSSPSPCWPLYSSTLFKLGRKESYNEENFEHSNRDSTINTSINATRVDKGGTVFVGKRGNSRESSFPSLGGRVSSVENRESKKNELRKRVSIGGKTGRRGSWIDWIARYKVAGSYTCFVHLRASSCGRSMYGHPLTGQK